MLSFRYCCCCRLQHRLLCLCLAHSESAFCLSNLSVRPFAVTPISRSYPHPPPARSPHPKCRCRPTTSWWPPPLPPPRRPAQQVICPVLVAVSVVFCTFARCSLRFCLPTASEFEFCWHVHAPPPPTFFCSPSSYSLRTRVYVRYVSSCLWHDKHIQNALLFCLI